MFTSFRLKVDQRRSDRLPTYRSSSTVSGASARWNPRFHDITYRLFRFGSKSLRLFPGATVSGYAGDEAVGNTGRVGLLNNTLPAGPNTSGVLFGSTVVVIV